jgi:hypothetical protein
MAQKIFQVSNKEQEQYSDDRPNRLLADGKAFPKPSLLTVTSYQVAYTYLAE